MARERVTSASKSCDQLWGYTKKLNQVAFTGTMIYIGYLFGSMSDNERSVQHIPGGDSVGVSKIASINPTVSTDANAPASSVEAPKSEHQLIKSFSAIENNPSKLVYSKGPVIYNDNRATTSINLLGERHSGTNWISDHLDDCVSFILCFPV